MIFPHSRLLLLLPACAALFLTGCLDEGGGYGDRVAYDQGGYYGGDEGPGYADADVDFVYEGGAPYSREYGPLVLRENRYYYTRGGTYYVYNRSASRHYRGGYASNSRGYRGGGDRYRSGYSSQQYRNQQVSQQYRTQQASQQYRVQQQVAAQRYQQQQYSQARQNTAVRQYQQQQQYRQPQYRAQQQYRQPQVNAQYRPSVQQTQVRGPQKKKDRDRD